MNIRPLNACWLSRPLRKRKHWVELLFLNQQKEKQLKRGESVAVGNGTKDRGDGCKVGKRAW